MPREWLHSDGVISDEPDLSAALARLEIATVPGFAYRFIRGFGSTPASTDHCKAAAVTAHAAGAIAPLTAGILSTQTLSRI